MRTHSSQTIVIVDWVFHRPASIRIIEDLVDANPVWLLKMIPASLKWWWPGTTFRTKKRRVFLSPAETIFPLKYDPKHDVLGIRTAGGATTNLYALLQTFARDVGRTKRNWFPPCFVERELEHKAH